MKTILLAISGSISFYKSYELISLFKKEKFKVKILLSNGVLKFVSKISFEALADEVLCEENESWLNNNNHISFTKDCDLILLAPASINSINKLAYGIADNLFMQTLIASNSTLIIAPAANTKMFLHFSIQKSLQILEKNNIKIIYPISKTLACKEEGIGALADIDTIFNFCKRELLKKDFWQNKKIIITCGNTKEKIDDVRYISNFSSGKMAKSIADAFYFLGADVVLLSSIEFKTNYIIEYFATSNELKKLMQKYYNGDFLIMTAAVSDFIPIYKNGKIKKANYPNGFDLRLQPNEDLICDIKFNGKKIGFKMELDTKKAIDIAKESLINKKLDMICLNILENDNYFGSDLNQLYFITKNHCIKSEMISKKDLAFLLVDFCEKLQEHK